MLLYLTLLTIGTGSWLFHMTLRYDMQLMDEVPMVFGSATLSYCIYQVMYSCENDWGPCPYDTTTWYTNIKSIKR